jgi:hypothetical protein
MSRSESNNESDNTAVTIGDSKGSIIYSSGAIPTVNTVRVRDDLWREKATEYKLGHSEVTQNLEKERDNREKERKIREKIERDLREKNREREVALLREMNEKETDLLKQLSDQESKLRMEIQNLERGLQNQIEELKVQLGIKATHIEHYEKEKRNKLVTTFVSLALVGIGGSQLGSSYNDPSGWILIIFSLIFYAIAADVFEWLWHLCHSHST